MQTNTASGIRADAIAVEYARREMATWSDVRLGDAVADIVEQPRLGTFDSFVLHAPLELAARIALLASVSPSSRRVARLRLVSLASRYEAWGPGTDPGDASSAEPLDDLIEAISEGDPDRAETAGRALARTTDRRQFVAALADFLIPLTSAAAHAPIFLHLLQRSDPRGPVTSALLAPLARDLARGSDRAIRWVERPATAAPTDPALLGQRLRTVPTQRTDSTFIHPIMHAIDASGRAERLLGDVVGAFDRRAAAELLRVAAQSMLAGPREHAPYGWTHCLTLPQAVIEIAHAARRPDTALAIAATHVAGFRAALGGPDVEDRPVDDHPQIDITAVIDAAATHHDAHVVKYVLACLDAASYDPEATPLYHAAAAHLIEVWRHVEIPDDPLPNAHGPEVER